MSKDTENKGEKSRYMGLSIAMSTGVGLIIGHVFFDNAGIGLVLGAGVGVALGNISKKK